MLNFVLSAVRQVKKSKELARIVKTSDITTNKLQKNRQYSVAVIGAGAMGRDQCLGLKAIPQAKLVAIADNNDIALERIRQEVDLTGAGLYTDAQELFKKEQLDLVCIATNTSSHLKIAEMAVDSNIPRIIVEKPIGNNVAKAKHFAIHCKNKNIKISVNHSRRWSETYAAIYRCIDKGFIGRIKQIQMVFGPSGFAMNGSHFIDLAAYLGNSPVAKIIGFLDKENKANKRGNQFTDPGGYAFFQLKNGIRASIDLSNNLGRKSKFLTLIGESGRIEIDERMGIWHIINDLIPRLTFMFSGPVKPVGLFTKVVQDILANENPSGNTQDAINTLEAIMAVHISDRKDNISISLPLEGKDADLEIAFP